MTIGFVSTPGAPKAIGPYSQAAVYGDLIFTAGQIALDPASMEIQAEGIVEQTERVLSNLEAVLEAAGSGLSGVLKTTVFLQSMSDFAAMNEVYARRFGAHRPARSTVAAAGLPRNVLVEIEVVAVKGQR
ncbi:MAG TPA: RidA family protein [Gemmatimonadales bacterium]|jgi:2-iminobutanoate/2-iminopropanoate deaminase|nr:RidA family protein [Gemmatimonadales bacterium]